LWWFEEGRRLLAENIVSFPCLTHAADELPLIQIVATRPKNGKNIQGFKASRKKKDKKGE
jgi:hypothetical protein